jgi:hypothetical protein
MFEILPIIIFGWPAMIGSLLLSVAGLTLRKPWLLVVAGIAAIPFSWFLSGYPGLRTPMIFLPLYQFASAWALNREKKRLAWVLLAPLAMIMLFLAVVVLTQPLPNG